MARLPPRTVLGQGRVRMRGDLRGERWLLGKTNAPASAGARTGPMAPGFGALAAPAPNRGWIDPEERGDINHAMTGIHRGQGSFTDVVGGVRALHHPTLPDTHLN